jgi:hypothetical protein
MLSPARLAEPPLHAVDTSRTATRSPLCRAAGWSLAALARLLAGASVRWIASQPDTCQRVYFANHTSHLDAIVVWSSLPQAVRELTRPVAARLAIHYEGNRRYCIFDACAPVSAATRAVLVRARAYSSSLNVALFTASSSALA